MPTVDQITRAKNLISEGFTQRAAARYLGISESTLRDHLTGRVTKPRRQPSPRRVEKPGVKITGDTATVTSPPSDASLDDTDRLLSDRGLDPADWDIKNMVVNEWDAYDGRALRQLKLHLTRRTPLDFVFPAAEPLEPRSRPAPRSSATGAFTVAFLGDQQAPYHDPAVHDGVLGLLETFQPDEVVLLGDTVDFPTISRHRDNPEWHVPVQACINGGYQLLSEYVDAAPHARFTKLLGNHDERIRNELLNRAERLYNIRPADVPGAEPEVDALSIRRLLRLDELAIDLVVPHGGYEHAQHKVNENLAARHGYLTGHNAASKTLAALGHSVVFGHTHHQGIFEKTVYDIDGNPTALVAVQAGCLCQVKGGLGYAVNPDWQQGCAVATVHTDGSFNVELATFADGHLHFRGERF